MTANEALAGHFAKMNYGECIDQKRRLLQYLEIPRHTLWRMCVGKQKIPVVYRREINNFFGEDIFDNITD